MYVSRQMTFTVVLFILLLSRDSIVGYPEPNVLNLICRECRLSNSLVSEIITLRSGVWTVDDAFFSVNRLQDVLDWAKEGDVVALKPSNTIPPKRVLIVMKETTIKSADSRAKTATMSYPLSDFLLFVKRTKGILENIIISDCMLVSSLEFENIVKLEFDVTIDEDIITPGLLNIDESMNDAKLGHFSGIDIDRPEYLSVTGMKVAYQNRVLKSTTELSSKVENQDSLTVMTSPSWEAENYELISSNLQVNHNCITLNIVENHECLINQYVSKKNDTECIECERDQYNFNPDSEECKSCPENADCSEDYILPLQGHWNSFPCSKHVQECPNRNACRGLDPSLLNNIISIRDPATCRLSMEDINKYQDAQCSDGYQGLLCDSCKDNYGKIGPLDCVPCRNRALIILSLTFSICLLIYSTRQQISACRELVKEQLSRRPPRTSPEERETNARQAVRRSDVPEEHINKAQNANKEFALVLQLFVNFMQGLGAALSLNNNWPEAVNLLLDVLNWFSQNVSQVYTFSFECLLPVHEPMHRSYLSTLLATLLPFLIICFMWTYWLIDKFRHHRSRKDFIESGILSSFSIFFFSFYSLSSTACYFIRRIRVFDAVSLDNVDASNDYWFIDTAIKGPWSSYFIVGLSILILHAFSFIFCIFVLPRAFNFECRRNRFELESVRESLGIRFIGLRPEMMWWDIAILIRKLSIAIINGSMDNENNLVWGISMALVFMSHLLLNFSSGPYRTEFDYLNFLEGMSLFVCGMNAVICSLLSNQILSSSFARVILISVVTFSSMLVFSIFAYLLVKNKFTEIKYELVVNGVVDEKDNRFYVIFVYLQGLLRNIENFIRNATKKFLYFVSYLGSKITNNSPSISLVSPNNV